jgi:hypothetical protein
MTNRLLPKSDNGSACAASRELRIERPRVAIWIADAHRDGKRVVVRADEKLTAFMELESAI